MRVQSIQILRGDAIDQIKFTYDDGTSWSSGQDCGKLDPRVAVMTDQEYLTRVTHERFINFQCAAAAVEFETNKGRVFSYNPITLATKRKSEQTTFHASPGQEIITLEIKKGLLIGIEQQNVPENVKVNKEWWTIVALAPKEVDVSHEDGFTFKHFVSRQEAEKAWFLEPEKVEIKSGRASILVDTLRMKVYKVCGNKKSIASCKEAATNKGFILADEESKVTMLSTVLVLMNLVNNKYDFILFVTVLFFLLCSAFLDTNAKLLTGQVLTVFNSNQAEIETNWFVQKSCQYVISCSGSIQDSRKALVFCFLLVNIFERFLYVVNVYIHHNACDSKNGQLSIKSFQHVLFLDQAFFDTKTESEIRSSMDARSINNLITWNVPYIIYFCFKLMAAFFYMFRISFRLGSVTLGFFVLIKFGVLNPLHHSEKSEQKLQQKHTIFIEQILSEALKTFTSIKLFSKEQFHIDQLLEAENRRIENLKTIVLFRCVREFSYGTLQVFIFGVVLYLSIGLLSSSEISAGAVTGFFLLYQEVQFVFKRLEWHHEFLVREFGDIERFLSLMKAEPKIIDGDQKSNRGKGEIVFENVCFEYPARPNELVLKGLNVTIKAKKITAIVGDSGAGKSTLAKLLMRLYDPKSGSILLDGINIKTLALEDLHKTIGIVSQNPELYNASLRDNIAYGATGEATDEQIIEAAKLAKCYDFIKSFRGGFDTYAGTMGSQLSGGQKQRIAIARVAIRNPSILVLDEATSALDAENEQAVQEALENIMQGKTILIIAHRLSTIKSADEIICMKDGEVVELGNHDQLMELKGTYFNLINKQLFLAPSSSVGLNLLSKSSHGSIDVVPIPVIKSLHSSPERERLDSAFNCPRLSADDDSLTELLNH